MGGFFGGGASVANLVGATSSAAGVAGLVPAPASGKQNSVLMGDANFLNLDKIQMLPDQVSDCVLWLRSDDLVTSGSNVTTWNNKVNSNKNAGQATATKQPTLAANQINGLSAVRFDGTDDCLTIETFSLRAQITVIMVLKQAATNKPFIIEHGSDAANNDGFYFYGDNFACNFRRSSGSTISGFSAWAGTSWNIFCVRFCPQSGSNILIGQYGASAGSINNSVVSSTLNIGSRNNGASFATSSDYAEVLIYDRPLWDFEIACINNYLKSRYAL